MWPNRILSGEHPFVKLEFAGFQRTEDGHPIWVQPSVTSNSRKPKIWKTKKGAVDCMEELFFRLPDLTLLDYCEIINVADSPMAKSKNVGYVVRKLVIDAEGADGPHFQYAFQEKEGWGFTKYLSEALVWHTQDDAEEFLQKRVMPWYEGNNSVDPTLCVAKARR